MLKILFLLTLSVFINSKVTPFDMSVVDYVIKENHECVFLLTTPNQTCNDAKKYFYEVGDSNDEIMFSHSDLDDENNFYRKICEYIGVYYKDAPFIVYYGERKQKHVFKGQMSKKNIQNFIKQAQQGSLPIFVKSKPITEENTGPLLGLTGNNFPEIVLTSKKQFLIKLYAPWCPHCKEMAEQFEEIAKRLGKNNNIMFGQMDYTVNEIHGIQITGYPAIIFWPKDKSANPIVYEGERTADDFEAWLKDHTEYEWIEPAYAPKPEEIKIESQKSTEEL